MRKDALNLAAHETLLMVVLPILGGELDVARFFFQNAVLDAARPQPRLIGLGVVGFVGIDNLGVGGRNVRKNFAVILAGRADQGRADQLMLTVAADVGFVAIKTLVVFAGVTRVGIRRSSFARGLGGGTFAAGFHQGLVHQRDAFDDVTARFQLGVEQAEQFLVQAALDQPLAKPADRGFIRHGFVRVELHELLEAQPVLELFFGLWIAQAVEVLQNHDAQQHPDTAAGASALTVGGGDALLGGSEVHFARYGFKNFVGTAALLHGQIKKSRLLVAFGLHGYSDPSPRQLFKILLQRFLPAFMRGGLEWSELRFCLEKTKRCCPRDSTCWALTASDPNPLARRSPQASCATTMNSQTSAVFSGNSLS